MPRPLLSIANDSPVDPTATSSRALLTSIPTNTSVLATVRHLRSGHAPPCAMRARSCAAPATVRALTWFFGRGDPRLPSASQTLDPRPFGLPRPSSCLYSDTDGKIQGHEGQGRMSAQNIVIRVASDRDTPAVAQIYIDSWNAR